MALYGAIPGTEGQVGREAEVARVVAALTSQESGLVMVAPGVEGAEGLGVTAVAAAAVRRPEVAERFPDGIGWLSAGSVHPEDWAAELAKAMEQSRDEEADLYHWLEPADLVDVVHGEKAVAELLGKELLSRPARRLLVVDGLRRPGLIAPLALAMPGYAWLVTGGAAGERLPYATTVPVGPMAAGDATALVRRGLPALDEAMAARLAELTGGWPLALAMARAAIVSEVGAGAAADEVAARLIARLPGAVDLAGPASRAALVAAIVDHSLDWLRSVDPAGAELFLRLGLFGEGEPVPIGVAVMLWSAGGSMPGGRIGALIARLEGLALVHLPADRPLLVLPATVHARVRELLGRDGLDRARQAMIDAGPDRTPEGWADLPGTREWSLRNRVSLYADAGATERLEESLGDLEWLAGRIERSGVAAALKDLDRAAGTPTAGLLTRVLARSTHLLETARELDVGIVPTLAARLHASGHMGEWARRPALECRWAPPDLPHPALLDVYYGRGVGRITALALSGDGTWLAAGGDTGAVVRRGLNGAHIEGLRGHWAGVHSIAIAPAGDWLATASDDGSVRLWELDGRPRAVLDELPGDARAVAIAPDGTWLVAAGEGFLRFWNADGTPRAVSGEAGETRAEYTRLAVSPDGTWLAAVGEEVAELWNDDGTRRATIGEDGNGDGTRRAAVGGEGNGARAVAIAPSGEWLAMIGDSGAVLLAGPDGSPRGELNEVVCHGSALAIAPDGAWLAVSGLCGEIMIMDLDGAVRARLHGHTRWVDDVAITPDGRRLVSAGDDHTIRVWDVDLAMSAGPAAPARHELYEIAMAGDGSYLATTGRGGVTVWDPDGNVRGHGPAGWSMCVAASPDGTFLAGGDADGLVCLYTPDGTIRRIEDFSTVLTRNMIEDGFGKPSGTLFEEMSEDAAFLVTTPVIAPDGTWMAVSVEDTALILTIPGEGFTPLRTGDDDVGALAIAPDSSWLAVGNGARIRFWTRTGEPLAASMETGDHITGLTVSPDGRLLAAATAEGVVELFDLGAGSQAEPLARFGRDDSLTGVAFSPDGARLLTSARNGCLRVWEVASRTCECAVVVEGELRGCVWLPDGSAVYAAGEAGLFGFTCRR